MKISLNWVFDHIDGNVHDVDVEQLVNTFIKTTAEIEEWRKVSLKVDDFTFVQVIKITDEFIEAYSPELKENYKLPVRSDVFVDLWYLVECKEKQSAWATIDSLGG